MACAKTPPEPADTARDTDPIGALVEKLSADRDGNWQSAPHPRLDIPGITTVEDMLNRLFQQTTFDDGPVTQYSILELRGVVVAGHKPESYRAALVDTNLGRKVVLFRLEGQDWWTRIFDAEPAAGSSQ